MFRNLNCNSYGFYVYYFIKDISLEQCFCQISLKLVRYDLYSSSDANLPCLVCDHVILPNFPATPRLGVYQSTESDLYRNSPSVNAGQ